jgi:hypothetical protein
MRSTARPPGLASDAHVQLTRLYRTAGMLPRRYSRLCVLDGRRTAAGEPAGEPAGAPRETASGSRRPLRSNCTRDSRRQRMLWVGEWGEMGGR